MHDWHHGLFSPCVNPLTCLAAFLCLPCEHGRNGSRLDTGVPGGCFGNCCDCLFASFFPCCAVMYQRSRIRSRLVLPRSCGPDWVPAWFCTCCAVAQHSNELKHHRVAPAVQVVAR